MEIFNPASIVISLVVLAAVLALVIFAIRKVVRWVKRRNAEGAEAN